MCLRVFLPLLVCQLTLCGAGPWSQIFLLHLADVHTDFMVERKRARELLCVCVCVWDACAVKLTGAGCPEFMHASQPSRSLALHIFSVYLCACCMVTWWRFSTSDSASAVKCVFTWASVTVDEQQDYTARHHPVTTFCCPVIHFLSTPQMHTLWHAQQTQIWGTVEFFQEIVSFDGPDSIFLITVLQDKVVNAGPIVDICWW